LIEVSASLSNKIIKKGDYFSIYVDITNGHEEPITITDVRLFQPVGFVPVKLNFLPRTFFDSIRNFFFYRDIEVSILEGSFAVKSKDSSENASKTFNGPENTTGVKTNSSENVSNESGSSANVSETFIGPSIIHRPHQLVQSKEKFREDFNLKAGWTGGLRPRADTYAISAEVTYEIENVEYRKQITANNYSSIKYSPATLPLPCSKPYAPPMGSVPSYGSPNPSFFEWKCQISDGFT
jgi:hypothetical protein